ncbi:hypothetical protein Tco_0350479, partial [Tanacetum coccineum]
AIDCKTPIEVWTGKPADYSKLRVFGCHAANQVGDVEHEVPEDTDYDVTSLDPPNSAHLEHEQYRSIALDRPRRDAKAPSRLGFQNYVAYALQVAEEVESLEPATYQEAITSKDSDM